MPANEQAINPPPLFNNASKKIAESKIFTSFALESFVENIAIDEAGDLFVTNLDEGAVYKIDAEGSKEMYASTKGKLAGIYFIAEETFLLNGWDENGISTIWLLNNNKEIIFLLQPDGALFLNGMASLNNNNFLICDSYKGCIWKYDLDTTEATIWLEHSLLKRGNETSPLPAANGIALFEDYLFVSNTERHLLLKIPVVDSSAGEPEIFMTEVNLDDFAIDNDGNIYATTHIYNSVVKITQDKKITIIADEEQGLTGSTAAAFGKRNDDKNCIYVTTNGGMSLAPKNGLEEGKIIKIKVN